ncbi:DVU0772 family protein [Pseudodesulfovibrio tunisiensis]|uniref:DVU0772 family protein n=1 Tax=Pseudodesulfovibrio tunisiensis TaxID=463192 RepID=UPI001FB56319|nr:hypothetical protein [Pseudodesulfovibrio tunisiensis]
MGSLRNFRNMDIDWNMTPEDAVTMYLEWGNNSWHAEHKPVTSKADHSTYFVVYAWDEKPRAILIRRNSEEARELAEVALPTDLAQRFLESTGRHKGVYAPTPEIRSWLEHQLN